MDEQWCSIVTLMIVVPAFVRVFWPKVIHRVSRALCRLIRRILARTLLIFTFGSIKYLWPELYQRVSGESGVRTELGLTVRNEDLEYMMEVTQWETEPTEFRGTECRLIAECILTGPETRPPHQQAARCQDDVKLQHWRVRKDGEESHHLVNGDLLSECISDLAGRDPAMIAAAIQTRTTNVCHYNCSAALQVATNRGTREIAGIILRNE
jgi:hypothetical protein